jgi:tight adherence protein C
MVLALRIVSWIGLGTGIWLAVYAAAASELVAEKRLGLRGLKRRRALASNDLFASIDPLVRLGARVTAFLPFGGVRGSLTQTLQHGGDWLGLDVDELLALGGLCGIAGLALGGLGVWSLDLPGAVVPFLGALGASLPYIGLTGEVQRRVETINRALPGAIDLGALSMTAGLAFPQAIEQIVTKSGDPEDPLNEELSLVLSQLRLGWTRKRALESFAQRIPSQAVRTFVSAVVQSEARGTPLVDVLRIQATTMRQRRSASGEEAAARAAVLMIVPLMLILCAIIVLLMGPFLIQGMASGF